MKRLLSLMFIASGIIVSQPAGAESDFCGTGPQTIPSESTMNISGSYNVYVKLGLPGQTASITAYSMTDSCQSLGGANVNGNTWTRVSEAAFTPDVPLSFEINGDIPGDNEAAAKPVLLLVPTSMPCIPNVSCDTIISGAKAYLSPIALTTSTSGLAIQQIVDPRLDSIKRVEYYTDGQLMYAQPELKPFNTAYADYYRQKIARVIVYNSGQRAVLEGMVTTNTDNPANFALRTYIRHSTLIIIVSITLTLSLFILITRAIVRGIENRKYYDYAHGLNRHTPTPLQAKIKTFIQKPLVQTVTDCVLIASGVVAAIIITSTFIITPYQVNGTSMFATLQNGQLLTVNKLPVTLNRQFKPTRGTIVIYHPNYGNLGYSDLREDSLLVKRIAALPGERVTSQEGRLRVFNSAHPEGYYLDEIEPWANKVTLQPSDAPFDITLGNDQVFVAGDNRPDSIDSRINGALPLSEIVGVVLGY